MPTRAPPHYVPQRHCFKPYTSLCAGAQSASEFSSMFRDQVLSRKVGEAASKVRRDFHAIRKVGERMGLMGAKLCFDAWRAWGKERRFQRERMAEEDRRKKILEAQEAWAAKRLQEAEKAKWVAKVDPFTDKVRTPHARTTAPPLVGADLATCHTDVLRAQRNRRGVVVGARWTRVSCACGSNARRRPNHSGRCRGGCVCRCNRCDCHRNRGTRRQSECF